MVFRTVPVRMPYLLDDVGGTSTGVIGRATALAGAATVVARSPSPSWIDRLTKPHGAPDAGDTGMKKIKAAP